MVCGEHTKNKYLRYSFIRGTVRRRATFTNLAVTASWKEKKETEREAAHLDHKISELRKIPNQA